MTSRAWFLTAFSVVVIAAVALLAGCGSSSDDTGNSAVTSTESVAGNEPTKSEESNEEVAAGEPIVIGSICPCSGAFASNYGAVPRIVKAWESWTNSHGGVNGHPVEVKLEDDGGNATVAKQKVKSLIEQDHVLALVGESNDAGSSAGWLPIANGAGVPVIGGPAFSPDLWDNPNFFGTAANYPISAYGMLEMAKAEGDTKVAVIGCVESPGCAGFGEEIGNVAKETVPGTEVVYSANVSGTAPSYTAQCIAAKEAGATAMYIGQAGSVVPRIIEGCVQQGFQPLQVMLGGSVISSWASDPNMDGMKIAAESLPGNDATTPGGRHFHEVLQAEDPSIFEASNFSAFDVDAWDGLELFAAAAKEAGIGPQSSSDDLKKGLYMLKDETLGGLTAPLTFRPGKPTIINCFFEETIENGEFTQNTKPFCAGQALGKRVIAAVAAAHE